MPRGWTLRLDARPAAAIARWLKSAVHLGRRLRSRVQLRSPPAKLAKCLQMFAIFLAARVRPYQHKMTRFPNILFERWQALRHDPQSISATHFTSSWEGAGQPGADPASLISATPCTLPRPTMGPKLLPTPNTFFAPDLIFCGKRNLKPATFMGLKHHQEERGDEF